MGHKGLTSSSNLPCRRSEKRNYGGAVGEGKYPHIKKNPQIEKQFLAIVL